MANNLTKKNLLLKSNFGMILGSRIFRAPALFPKAAPGTVVEVTEEIALCNNYLNHIDTIHHFTDYSVTGYYTVESLEWTLLDNNANTPRGPLTDRPGIDSDEQHSTLLTVFCNLHFLGKWQNGHRSCLEMGRVTTKIKLSN
jgi:hypothetical protein